MMVVPAGKPVVLCVIRLRASVAARPALPGISSLEKAQNGSAYRATRGCLQKGFRLWPEFGQDV